MPTGSKTAVAGRGRTNDSATILDPGNGMYTYKPYQPHLYDFRYREYKYKPYKPVYEDPLRTKTEVLRPYRSYVPQVSYKRSLDYQLPKQGDLSVRKEEPIIRESVKVKSPKQSQPARKPPVVVTNNNIYNEATHLKSPMGGEDGGFVVSSPEHPVKETAASDITCPSETSPPKLLARTGIQVLWLSSDLSQPSTILRNTRERL